MALELSFPNLICLLLLGFLLIHLMSRERTMGSHHKSAEDLKQIFCRLPQSFNRVDLKMCTSTEKLFRLLMNDCSSIKRKSEKAYLYKVERNDSLEVEYVANKESKDFRNDEQNNQVLEDADVDEVGIEEKPPEEKSSFSLVDSFVISLLVCSAAVSILELYREKSKSRDQVAHGDAGAAADGEPNSNRRISLAELTVNRHLRRRDSQLQLETIRQNSTSGSKPPPLIRRSSFPAQFPEAAPSRSRHAPRRQQSTPGIPLARRLSVDLSEDDSSPDRRRVRIIRRH